MTGLFDAAVALLFALHGQPAPIAPPGLPRGEASLANSIRVELRLPKTTIPVGSEVMVEFCVQNTTDEPLSLTVPGALTGKERPDLGMGLPLEHVYSAAGFKGLDIQAEDNSQMGERITRKPEFPVPAVTLAPFGTIGLRFDVTRFYPGLHQAGIYVLNWRPYGGVVEAPTVTLNIIQYKQVILDTDIGTLNIRLLYDRAPNHVANFLDLVDKRFYNGKVFHVVFPNQFILGGCPDGTGTGKRPDGACLSPEFNDTPFDLGTLGMALIEGDPNSGSSQFFVCLSRQASFDGKYTAFAQVDGPQSLATLKKLGDVPTDGSRRPRKPLIIKSMSAIDAPFTPRTLK